MGRSSVLTKTSFAPGRHFAFQLGGLFKSGFNGIKVVWTAVETLALQASSWKPVGGWAIP